MAKAPQAKSCMGFQIIPFVFVPQGWEFSATKGLQKLPIHLSMHWRSAHMWIERCDKHEALIEELVDADFVCLDAQH